jgi:hypothetical protein
MEFEFTTTLKDGRRVAVTGQAIVLHGCDCGGHMHAHIETLEITSCILLGKSGDLDGPNVLLTPAVRTELEKFSDDYVYNELEKEGVA